MKICNCVNCGYSVQSITVINSLCNDDEYVCIKKTGKENLKNMARTGKIGLVFVKKNTCCENWEERDQTDI